MNILFRMEKGIAVCLFSSFFVLACVNHIPGEKAAVSNGDIPLKFTADIQKRHIHVLLAMALKRMMKWEYLPL